MTGNRRMPVDTCHDRRPHNAYNPARRQNRHRLSGFLVKKPISPQNVVYTSVDQEGRYSVYWLPLPSENTVAQEAEAGNLL
jgi:hypothetical protein